MTASIATKYEHTIPDVLQTMAGVHQVLDNHGLDLKIRHLVQLRASQINRCGFCIKMHTKEARQNGETSERLDRVIAWDHSMSVITAVRAAKGDIRCARKFYFPTGSQVTEKLTKLVSGRTKL